MRTTKRLSVTLPHEMADMVRAKVTSGEYASECEVIRDGLRTLAARDRAVEAWLSDRVGPGLRPHAGRPGQCAHSGTGPCPPGRSA